MSANERENASDKTGASSTVLMCEVCPHGCTIREGGTGLCGARGIEDGQIVSLNYGQATALALDPIEKKPLARFHPGSLILSYGSFGCNMRCAFCQNADISQVCSGMHPRTSFISSTDLVVKAESLVDVGNIGVAITYNEPMIAPEFLVDTGSLLHDRSLMCVVVTNGYVSPDVFDRACSVTDAMNIDLKCFSEKGYEQMGAPNGLATVKRNIETAFHAGVHVELTTLIVPGISDLEDGFREEVAWIAHLSPEIPLHLSRFFPTYRMSDGFPTDISLMKRFQQIAEDSLSHVYLGNV